MATLTAFCDETCTHEGAPTTGVGGYVFDEDGRRRFTECLHETLRPLRERGIESFHAGDCYHRVNEFSGLSESEKDLLFRELISLTRSTAKFGLICAIEEKAFTTAIKRNKLKSFTGSKYTACALHTLDFIGRWVDDSKLEGDVLYLFESGNEHRGEAEAMLDQVREIPELRKRFRYRGHDFSSKHLHVPLQAADMLLWLWQRSLGDRKMHEYFRELVKPPGRIPHWERRITHLDLGLFALDNMAKGLKSNRKYEIQTGRVKTYTF